MRLRRLALGVAIALVGCATEPLPHSVENARSFPMSKDQVWDNLIAYFSSNSIQIKTIEKASGVIYAERGVDRPASYREIRHPDYADCGTPPITDIPVGHTVDLNVFVRSTGSSSVAVTVNARIKEVRRVPSAGGFSTTLETRDCVSTGKIEEAILTAIGAPS